MGKGWLLLLAIAAAPSALAGEHGIARIDPIPAAFPQQDAVQTAGLFSERIFPAASNLKAVVGNGRWRLQPEPGIEQPLLLVYHPYSAKVTVKVAADAIPDAQTLFDPDLDPQYSRHALVFPLQGDGPVYVQVEDARYPLQVAVRARSAHVANDLLQVRVLLGSVGVLVGVSLTVLLFWAMLRERVYLKYALCILLQVLFLLCSYGESYALPGLRVLGLFGVYGIWFIGTLSTASAIYLLLDYAGLRPRVPRLSRLLRWLGMYAPLALLVPLVLPWPADKQWFPSAANALYLAGNLLAIVALVRAWGRGGRHAGYVLIAWLPLVVLSTARAVQLSMGTPIEPWLQFGLPLAVAYTAVVLALGLADRMRTFRQERDVAQEHAERDALTGVLNRGGIEHRLEWALWHARHDEMPMSLLFLDLDGFKGINDVHGHALGDSCLRTVVATLSEELHYGDNLGRLGGDEFVLSLRNTDPQRACIAAERLRRRIEQACAQIDGVPVALTASIGVAHGGDGDTVPSLLKRADQAMYAAKRAGRNRVVVLEPDPPTDADLSAAPLATRGAR
jgi:diguanylate cyclase (GGDEF)-like protein